MDLMTGKPFYHSEWGELFAMLPFDVQDSIASAIWRYVFSNHVLKIPTTIKILEPGELHRNQTMSEWVSLAANGYEDKTRIKWYEVRSIHQKLDEMAEMAVGMMRQKNPALMDELFHGRTDTTNIFHEMNNKHRFIWQDRWGEDVDTAIRNHPNWTKEVMGLYLHNSRNVRVALDEGITHMGAWLPQGQPRETLEEKLEDAAIEVRRMWRRKKHSSVISHAAKLTATRMITFRQSHVDMCHCLNKDGSVCGAQEVNEMVTARVNQVDIGQVFDTVDGSNCLPCGINLGCSLGSDNDLQGNYRYMRMPVCRKHHKEADKCGGDVMINKTLAAWGYGNHNGYVIRTDDAPEYNHSFGCPIRVPKMSKRMNTNHDKSKYEVKDCEIKRKDCENPDYWSVLYLGFRGNPSDFQVRE